MCIRTALLPALLAGVLALPGCGPAEDDRATDTERPSPGAADTSAERGEPDVPPPPGPRPPAERQDTVLIEGRREPVRLRLVESPPEFPIPFSTYAPQGFTMRTLGSGEETVVRFVAAFGGTPDERAYLEVVPYPADAPEAAAVAGALEVAGTEASPDSAWAAVADWVVREWRFLRLGAREPYVGSVLLGRTGDRWLHVLMRYPPEYGDGFGPRARLILETWRWERPSG